MSNKKHYIITSITLGLIAAASGALIGVTNLITKDKIAKNEVEAINAGIVEIFGKNATIAEENDVFGYKYTTKMYKVDLDKYTDRYAFKTTGSNMYGKISLIVGFTRNVFLSSKYFLEGISIVVNEQTYATTLVDNYINPVSNGTRDIDDVSCGATYGAKLVRDMVNEAKEVAGDLL